MQKVEEGLTADALSPTNFELGLITISPDQTVSLVQRTEGKPLFSYAGEWKTRDSELLINVKLCSDQSVEGKTLSRKIDVLTTDRLVLSFSSQQGAQHHRVTWQRIL